MCLLPKYKHLKSQSCNCNWNCNSNFKKSCGCQCENLPLRRWHLKGCANLSYKGTLCLQTEGSKFHFPSGRFFTRTSTRDARKQASIIRDTLHGLNQTLMSSNQKPQWPKRSFEIILVPWINITNTDIC